MQYFASISAYTGTVAGIQSKKKGNDQELTKYLISDCSSFCSLASRLNGYMYSNGKSLNVALFILMANHLAWCNLA